MDVQTILVPIDYSDDAQQALHWGASLARKYGAKLLLLHVIAKAVEEVYPEGAGLMGPTPPYYDGRAPGIWMKRPIIIDHVDTAQTELRDFASKILQDTVPVEVHIAVGKPSEEIVRVAREDGVDLMIMGTHGRTGVRHLLLGSVAEDVTRHAPCPVFTVRIAAAGAS
jgi:nucleotide-binding universal stress UspA family protein